MRSVYVDPNSRNSKKFNPLAISIAPVKLLPGKTIHTVETGVCVPGMRGQPLHSTEDPVFPVASEKSHDLLKGGPSFP